MGAARALGVDRRSIQRMIQRGELPAEKLPGVTGSYVLNHADVMRKVAERAQSRMDKAVDR